MVLISNVELPSQDDNIIRTKDLDVPINPKGLSFEIFKYMRKNADAIAQIKAECEESDTFQSLLDRSIRVASHLKQRNISSEDIILPCTTNDLNSIITLLAPVFIGAKVACVDLSITVDDIREMLTITKPKLAFVFEEYEEKLEKIIEDLELRTEIVVLGETQKHTPFADFLKPLPKDEEEDFVLFEAKNLNDDAIIVFSSGLSGTPKAVGFSHLNVLSQLQRLASLGRNNTNFLTYSNLTWISTLINVLGSLISGNCRLISSKFDPAMTWKYLVKYDIKNLVLPPRYALQFLRYGNPEHLETPNLRSVTVTGGSINNQHIIDLKKLFAHPTLVICPYNTTEVCGRVFAYDNIELLMNHPGSSGLPIAGLYYKIVDPITGNNCGPNKNGELCIKSTFCASNYYNTDSPPEFFDEDGFLRTGDLAYYDANHFFYIIDKIDGLFLYEDSLLIPSTLLESILYQHPAVKIAAIIAIHSNEEDIAMGVVVKKESTEDVTEGDLITFFNDKVNDLHKIRGGIIFVNESVIPYSATGKIRKRLLCKMILEDFDDVDLSINIM
ncbi:hypothetical protein Trydic_g21372 [Trypoxylus dichotomus]